MARIPLPKIDPASMRPSIKGLAERDALINIFKIVLTSPELGSAYIDVAMTMMAYTELSPIDREISILVVGTYCESAYEIAQHEPASLAVGVTDEQREAITRMRWDSPVFTAAQAAMVKFVVAVLDKPTTPDEVMEAVRQHYSDRQVVELVLLAGLYFTVARMATVFDLEIDAPDHARLIETFAVIGQGIDYTD